VDVGKPPFSELQVKLAIGNLIEHNFNQKTGE